MSDRTFGLRIKHIKNRGVFIHADDVVGMIDLYRKRNFGLLKLRNQLSKINKQP